MHYAGVLPEDAPDPRIERAELLGALPIPVIGLVAQPSIGHTDFGVQTGTDGRGVDSVAVSLSSTVWRNPDDHSDPVNLAELDDATRRSLDLVPPWPRPQWLIDTVERMRYPTLSEAVRTNWNRDRSERSTLEFLLVHHANHVLMNRFRTEIGLGMNDWDSPALASTRSVRHGIEVIIDGEAVTGAEIDTDPFVYAVGADLPNGGTLTAVIPREYLSFVRVEFARRTEPLSPDETTPPHRR